MRRLFLTDLLFFFSYEGSGLAPRGNRRGSPPCSESNRFLISLLDLLSLLKVFLIVNLNGKIM
jgi:hypothetical protein